VFICIVDREAVFLGPIPFNELTGESRVSIIFYISKESRTTSFKSLDTPI
jgi:hypothetical protein